MNKTEDCTPISWAKTPNGGWKATVSGVEYLIEWHDNRYYLYKSPEREQIDSNKSLLLLKWITECL
nr:MAG TPA: hypothetical protein [Caudoviricetes sp.]